MLCFFLFFIARSVRESSFKREITSPCKVNRPSKSSDWSFITGKRLPQPQTQSAVVPLDYTFLLTGGLDADFNELAHVYQYDVQKEDWIKLPTELKTPRKQHVALLVTRSLFTECE